VKVRICLYLSVCVCVYRLDLYDVSVANRLRKQAKTRAVNLHMCVCVSMCVCVYALDVYDVSA
jgi:hypothetical protein